jgi:isoleucyl-tRNA synthetase
MKKYPEYKQLDLSKIGKEILQSWEENQTFEKSVSSREGKKPFVFYEGPPSANGMPGIHHVMARAIKDIFCRFKTLKGFQVKRKAGWDTHGLPIELAVEKTLGITKEDIGKKISVEEYNAACRKEVMKYTDKWEELTKIMGYWVDMQEPYVTYDNKYIESVWWLLKDLYKKNLLYKGYTIQPYSPAAGTGLSSHELNQPGCYRDVKDRTAVAMFKLEDGAHALGSLLKEIPEETFALAWTTTPWTLPANTALAVGVNVDYSLVKTFNQFTHKPVAVILATDLLKNYFSEKNAALKLEDYKEGDKNIPFRVVKNFKGKDLLGLQYEQLLPFVLPAEQPENAFKIIAGDFVTTEDGTGIVHIAPTFGADDMRAAKAAGVPAMLVKDENAKLVPTVDLRGRFRNEIRDGVFLFGGEYVKEAYMSEEEKQREFNKQKKILEEKGKIKDLKVYLSVDERIILKLQEEGKLFKKESYEHNYPHCWRTDKPVLYYPLDSWFIKVTEKKDRLIALNKQINWKPEATGTGRFGNWLENANDWNLSRSRYWGIPLPVWRSEDGEEKCIGSIEELNAELHNAVIEGMVYENEEVLAKVDREIVKQLFDNWNTAKSFLPLQRGNLLLFDLHKPYIDSVVLLSSKGLPMYREADLIDVWFDSGAMPYAQLHYPFENKDLIDDKKYFPADFIAEGVDQTRGWFYTLHAIATLCFDSVAYKNVVSNGLVLDKNGNKMSKRLGNAVDPFTTIEKYGADATRWYMIANAAPWDNLKFDVEGIAEVQRKLFGTLYNTYNFYALYANVDGFVTDEKNIVPVKERTELDRWIISKLNSLIAEVTKQLEEYEPHRAARAIEEFVDEHLSNWYVRLSRRVFWKGEMGPDKKAAYETLHECLLKTSQLMSPIAPFFADWLYSNLAGPVRDSKTSSAMQFESVHLSLLENSNEKFIDKDLEERMDLAQKISSMVLSIRKKENIKVRQPLTKIQIPVLDEKQKENIAAVQDLILAEVNVKSLEFADEKSVQVIKNLKLNFKTLGKKCGANMKAVQAFAAEHAKDIISGIEKTGKYIVQLEQAAITLEAEDVEIIPVDIPGWKVVNSGVLTVALDVTLTDELKQEGIARELVNRIQNIRKDKGLEVTDRINIKILRNNLIDSAINNNLAYICNETLTNTLEMVETLGQNKGIPVEVDESLTTEITVEKLN